MNSAPPTFSERNIRNGTGAFAAPWWSGGASPPTSPLLHWHSSGLEPIINIQYDFLGRGCGGNHSQEQTRRVCDAGTANSAEAGSIRKQSAGYAMLRNKPGGFVTRQAPILQMQRAYPSAVKGMRCYDKERFPPQDPLSHPLTLFST